jgi:hypothetical protein
LLLSAAAKFVDLVDEKFADLVDEKVEGSRPDNKNPVAAIPTVGAN